MRKLRFVKLVVIPYVVIDDGKDLLEFPIEPLEVAGDEVVDFINGGIVHTFNSLQASFEAQEDDLSDM